MVIIRLFCMKNTFFSKKICVNSMRANALAFSDTLVPSDAALAFFA